MDSLEGRSLSRISIRRVPNKLTSNNVLVRHPVELLHSLPHALSPPWMLGARHPFEDRLIKSEGQINSRDLLLLTR